MTFKKITITEKEGSVPDVCKRKKNTIPTVKNNFRKDKWQKAREPVY